MSIIIKVDDEMNAFQFVKRKYVSNNNLAIDILYYDEYEENWMEYVSLTKNVDDLFVNNSACLDDINCPSDIIEWLYRNKYAQIYGRVGGYPLVKFSDAFMEMILVEE